MFAVNVVFSKIKYEVQGLHEASTSTEQQSARSPETSASTLQSGASCNVAGEKGGIMGVKASVDLTALGLVATSFVFRSPCPTKKEQTPEKKKKKTHTHTHTTVK